MSFVLHGFNITEEKSLINEKNPNTSFAGIEQFKRKIIVRDSVYDPLPPEVKNLQSIPGECGPQQIPNADLTVPFVITKMPYIKK